MLRFLSLTVEDFGPYKNRQTIDFTSDDGVTIWGIMVRVRQRCLMLLDMPCLESVWSQYQDTTFITKD